MRELERVRKAAEALKESEAQTARARKALYAAIRTAHPKHTVRRIAQEAGVSFGRVGQIVRGEK
jgi:hypothetical protein